MKYVDKQVQQLIEKLDLGAGPAPSDIPIDELRATFSALWKSIAPLPHPMYRTEEIEIPGPKRKIRCKLDIPCETDQLLPVLIYYHRGGCCILLPEDYHGVTTTLAAEANCIVVTPDFRKAPEHPFPAALEDSYSVLRWLQQNAIDISGDPEKIAIAGDSGGGYLQRFPAPPPC